MSCRKLQLNHAAFGANLFEQPNGLHLFDAKQSNGSKLFDTKRPDPFGFPHTRPLPNPDRRADL